MGTLIYLIKQGFENVWKNKLMFIASVLIVSTSMLTLGIFTIVAVNVEKFVGSLKSEQTMIAFLEENVEETRIDAIGRAISGIPGVTKVEHETKEEAQKNAKEEFFNETTIGLTEGWEKMNIFTDSFSIYVDDLSKAKDIKDIVGNMDGVRNVDFEEEVVEFIEKTSELIKTIVVIVFVLLVAISLLVISNTIKLGLHSRRKEINIMKYIGATDAFVKTPFIIEGIIVGTVGAYISWMVTMPMYEGLKNMLEGLTVNFEWVDLSQRILHTNLIIGIGISCIACMISIKKYLEV